MVNTHSRSRSDESRIAAAWCAPGPVDQRLLHRLAGAAVLDEPAPDPGQAGVASRGRALRLVAHDVVVVRAGDRTGPASPCRRKGKAPTVSVWKWYMRLRPTRPDEFARPLAQQQAGRLEGAGGEHHVGGAHLVLARRAASR